MKIIRGKIKAWLEKRDKHEACLIYLTGFAVIFIVWSVLIKMPIHYHQEELIERTKKLMVEVQIQQQQLNIIEAIITSSSLIHEMGSSNNLQKQSQKEKRQIKSPQIKAIGLTTVSDEWLARITNDIIAEQKEVTLISLRSFPEEPWMASKAFNLNRKHVYKHKMQMEFKGTYFNTIDFLARLEKLPWRIYWDSLDYKVLVYPEADVIAQFYVLSN